MQKGVNVFDLSKVRSLTIQNKELQMGLLVNPFLKPDYFVKKKNMLLFPNLLVQIYCQWMNIGNFVPKLTKK